jgi:hypothetical protein
MRILFLVFLVSGGYTISASAQTPREVFQTAVDAASNPALLSAEVRFSADIISPKLDADGLARLAKLNEDMIKGGLEAFKESPEIRKSLEESLANLDKTVTLQAEANRKIAILGVYRASGPAIGGDRLLEAKIQKGADPPYDCHTLHRFSDEKNVQSVFFDVGSGMVTVSTTPAGIGIPDPLSLGRLSGPALLGSEHVTCSFDETWQSERKEEICFRFEIQGRANTAKSNLKSDMIKLIGRAVIDPTRGHTCSLFEYGSIGMEPDLSVVSSEFFQVKGTDVWFPQKCVVRTKKADGVEVADVSFRPEDVVMQQEFSSEMFSLKIPPGTILIYQLGEPQQRKAFCEVSIDIDGLGNLLDNKCLFVNAGKPVSRAPFFAYTAFALVLLFSFLYLGFRKWKQR